jgi:hypothetical protein
VNHELGLTASRQSDGNWLVGPKWFRSFGEVVRYYRDHRPGLFCETVFGVDMAKPGSDRTAIVTGRRHGKRAEFSLYIDGHKVPNVTRIEFVESGPTLDGLPYCGLPDLKTPGIKGEIKFTLQTKPSSDDPIGEILRNSPHPFRGIDHPSTQARLKRIAKLDCGSEVLDPEKFEKEALKAYGDGLHADINAPSPLLQILNVQEPSENLTNAATVSTWSNPPEYTLEQLKADIKEFRDRFPPPPETMFERVQRELGKVLFEPIPPAYFDENFDQVVTAEFERMKKLIWPKDDAEPEARTMLYEAIVTELRRRRKLGIPDPKYLRAQEPSEGEGEP